MFKLAMSSLLIRHSTALSVSLTHSGTRYELSRYPVEEENLTSHCDNSGLSGIEWFGIYLENIMTSYVR